MATLKALRDRRKTIQSTQKITMAMKMVAGAKLRRAQEHVEAGRPYAYYMRQMLKDLAVNVQALETPQPLLTGRGKDSIHLILVATSDRGLCGPFNSSLVRQTRKLVESLRGNGKSVQICTIGRKGKDMLVREYGDLMVKSFMAVGQSRLQFSDAQRIGDGVLSMFQDGLFDVCTLIYNHFKSALTQEVTVQQIIPVPIEVSEQVPSPDHKVVYEYEPDEEKILGQLLPQNVIVQIYNALLESAASERGSRMTAMDNASRNADEMIRKLSLSYNRTRQAQITRELSEIISGAEALQ
ncbi:MAG TPA: F0F1 ATP synthase subunit gamma [Holosporales bacterium]|nr:F0F1 ATP synthase subunit gamma [Holosporales bacterium]